MRGDCDFASFDMSDWILRPLTQCSLGVLHLTHDVFGWRKARTSFFINGHRIRVGRRKCHGAI